MSRKRVCSSGNPIYRAAGVDDCVQRATAKQVYKPDFVCYGKIIVELKAAHALLPEHRAQTFNYLTATQMRLALLVNFGHFPGVEIKRIVV